MSDEILSIKNFITLNPVEHKTIMREIFESKNIYDHNHAGQKASHNFKIQSQHIFFKYLYEKLLSECETVFGPLTLAEHNSKELWGYCTNKDYWESVPHDHSTTSVINSVYYVNVPKEGERYLGPFKYINKHGEWVDYQVEPFELLIMPGHITHDTGFTNSEEWRVSLNMEIITK